MATTRSVVCRNWSDVLCISKAVKFHKELSESYSLNYIITHITYLLYSSIVVCASLSKILHGSDEDFWTGNGIVMIL